MPQEVGPRIVRTALFGVLTLAVSAGCGPSLFLPDAEGGSDEAEDTGTSGDVPPNPGTWTNATSPPEMTTSNPDDDDDDVPPDPDGTSGGVSDESSDDGIGFIENPDTSGLGIECSIWEEDCPRGEKCMPWANDGGGAWNATRCSPIARNPAGPGEACEVIDSGVSGIDTCELHAMCWNVDHETLEGTCVSMCIGTRSNPTCADENEDCNIASDGALAICLPDCDPIAQDCPEGQACYPIGDDFECAPDVSGREGAPGDTCEFINVCDPGSACLPDVVPGCGAASCCSPFCVVGRGDGPCLDGQECVSWWDPGFAPPGEEHIGICAAV